MEARQSIRKGCQMKRIIHIEKAWFFAVFILLVPAVLANPVWAQCTLPATGQTECYDNQGPVPCPAVGFPGQDAETAYNAFSYTLVTDIPGQETVIDNNTELEWTQAAFPKMNWQQALQLADTLHWGGHDDWRMPNLKELQSLPSTRAAGRSIRSSGTSSRVSGRARRMSIRQTMFGSIRIRTMRNMDTPIKPGLMPSASSATAPEPRHRPKRRAGAASRSSSAEERYGDGNLIPFVEQTVACSGSAANRRPRRTPAPLPSIFVEIESFELFVAQFPSEEFHH